MINWTIGVLSFFTGLFVWLNRYVYNRYGDHIFLNIYIACFDCVRSSVTCAYLAIFIKSLISEQYVPYYVGFIILIYLWSSTLTHY